MGKEKKLFIALFLVGCLPLTIGAFILEKEITQRMYFDGQFEFSFAMFLIPGFALVSLSLFIANK